MSGIGGVRGTDPYGARADDGAEEAPAADAGSPPAAGAAIAPPEHGQVATDTAAALLQARFGAQATGGAPASTGSAKVDGTLDRINDQQEQRDALIDQRDSLQAQVDDPSTDPWDKVWLGYQLADTNCQISQMTADMGHLEDKLVDQVLNQDWGNLQDLMQTCVDLQETDNDHVLGLEDAQSAWNESDTQFQSQQQSDLDARRTSDRAHADALSQAQGNQEHALRLLGKLPPPPPGTVAARDALGSVLERMKAIDAPTLADLDRLRSDLERIRGAVR